jgi:hypothetical protein
MDHGKTNVMASRFVGTRRISDESGKLYNREVRNVGILNHGSDDTPSTESTAGGTASEHFGGIANTERTHGAESVAAVKNQLAPPIKASARSQMTGRIRI